MVYSDFNDFYRSKLEESIRAGVRPGNEEKFTDRSDKNQKLKFLYIHGYAASRADGEYVMDRVAAHYNASVYYLRLPGHGTTMEDHALSDLKDYIKCADEALVHMDLLPGKLIVTGTSMGGAIAALLASRHTDRIAGLILVSPFFGFFNKFAKITGWPLGTAVITAIYGAVRTADSTKSAKVKQPAGNRLFRYEKQYYRPLRNLAALEKLVTAPEVLSEIRIPVCMFYYYKNEKEQDFSASVKSMNLAFRMIGGSDPHPANRSIRVENGAHVMLSRYIKSDHEFVFSEIREFIDDII